MQITKLLLPAVATALLLPATAARADFGSRGTIALESNIDLGAVHEQSTDRYDETTSQTTIALGAGASM